MDDERVTEEGEGKGKVNFTFDVREVKTLEQVITEGGVRGRMANTIKASLDLHKELECDEFPCHKTTADNIQLAMRMYRGL